MLYETAFLDFEAMSAYIPSSLNMFLLVQGTACVYGDGIYFARDAEYSHRYASPDENGVHTVLLCKIAIGRTCKGIKGMQKPELDCHSAVNDLYNPTIYVIFDKDQIIPLWIIEYTTA